MSEQIQTRSEIITGEQAIDLTNAILRSATNLKNPRLPEFVNESEIYSSVEGGYAPEALEMQLEHSIPMPVHMFVGAINFKSWDGRANGHLKDGKSSKAVVEDYASRDSDIPGIDMGVDMFLDDDGDVYIYSHNSHRLAASRRRGQEKIGVKGRVRVFHLANKPYSLTQKDNHN